MLNRSPTPSTPVSPHAPSCWPAAARALLITLAIPIALGFVAGPGGTKAGPAPAPWPALVVDGNTAPVPVLEALPGLGPALAGRIVAARAIRPFESLADVDRRVKGIGPAKVAALQPFLKFAAPADLAR